VGQDANWLTASMLHINFY